MSTPEIHHSPLKKAVFLDKDGTLIEDIAYNVDPSKIQLTTGAIEGLRLLHTAHYQLFIITNQSGIAHGYFPEIALMAVKQRLQELLSTFAIPLKDFYYCPHHPEGIIPSYAIACTCRKPKPGLLYQAAIEYAIDLRQSWFIGDILHDVEAGRVAGCRTILINNGNETEWQLSLRRLPHHIVSNLYEAAHIIVTIDQITSIDLIPTQ